MVDLLEARRRILLNTPHLESISGATASFETDIASNLKECKIHFTPVQEGTGDPSPDNVRPIHGWDGVTVYKNGAEDFYNYSNVTALNSASVRKINDKSFRLYALNRKYPASKQPTSSLNLTIGKRYIISFDITIDSMASGHICVFGFRNTANTFQADGRVNISESGHYILDFVYDSNVNKNYLSLCETSGASVTFDATISNLGIYEVLEITIPFPQTIYGGYVDLVKGEVVEEIDSEGQQITPNSYSITPQTIRTLKGLNSIWSDANGNIELKFWTH